MQFKKDNLAQTLLKNAEEEFFQKGFKAASLRQIAKKSGTTIGNLYHYFDSKEALFEALVKEEYEGFRELIQDHQRMGESAGALKEWNVSLWRKVLKSLVESLSPIFSRRFYLLINCSEGTWYESAREALVKFMEEHFTEHLKNSKTQCSPELGRIISQQLLASILTIIRDHEDEQKKTELITEILLFTLMGVMGVLGTL